MKYTHTLAALAATTLGANAATVVWASDFEDATTGALQDTNVDVGTMTAGTASVAIGSASSGSTVARNYSTGDSYLRLTGGTNFTGNLTSTVAREGAVIQFDLQHFGTGSAGASQNERAPKFSINDGSGNEILNFVFEYNAGNGFIAYNSSSESTADGTDTTISTTDITWYRATATLGATDWTLKIEQYANESNVTGALTSVGEQSGLAYMAGATSELGEFAFSTGGGVNFLDNVQITAVPEPSSTALLGLGGLALILRRRK